MSDFRFFYDFRQNLKIFGFFFGLLLKPDKKCSIIILRNDKAVQR